jgi:anhydro-N-acetylmuramic acid kinase
MPAWLPQPVPGLPNSTDFTAGPVSDRPDAIPDSPSRIFTTLAPADSGLLWLGLMSGTSTDGVDGVVARFDDQGGCHVLAHCFMAFDADLRHALLSLQRLRWDMAQGDPFLALEATTARLTRVYADCASDLLARLSPDDRATVRAAGAHGQTLRHRPDIGLTLQSFNPALFQSLTGLAVVSDFRRADVARGGQGAPLVPAFHRWWMRAIGKADSVAVLNIGGFANVTLLQGDQVRGFDTGPGNVLMDGWVHRHKGLEYDADGAWAAGGHCQPDLLAALMAHPFFSRAAPKSTGRDEFNLVWLDSVLNAFEGLDPQDVQASLLALTAQSISAVIPTACTDLWVCGGGAYNTALMQALSVLMPHAQVAGSDRLGVPPNQVEALAFAWLARQRLCGRPGNLPSVTGASDYALLGSVTA